jgi:hypothetical protein
LSETSINQFTQLSLHDISLKYDTDKGHYHNFAVIYDYWLQHLRHDRIEILEIGYATGGSAMMWAEYFIQHTAIHCVDINSAPINLPSTFRYWQIDQSIKEQLDSLPHNLGLIVDDGGHTMEQQQISFVNLLSHLKPAGIYIIEDLHTSLDQYAMTHGSTPTNNSIKLLQDLQRGYLSYDNEYYINGREFFRIHKMIKSIDIFKTKEDSITARIVVI